MNYKEVLNNLIECPWRTHSDCAPDASPEDIPRIEYISYEGMSIDLQFDENKCRWYIIFNDDLDWLKKAYKQAKLPLSFKKIEEGQKTIENFLIRYSNILVFL